MPNQAWHLHDHGFTAQQSSLEWRHIPEVQFSTRNPPTQQSRKPISPEEWAARRSDITDLYRHRGWTLPRVMQEMAKRGFYAS